MPTSFSITRSRCHTASDAALREEIRAHTASDDEVASILRSIERFEGDPSIGRYEMTANPRRGTRHDARAVSWSVRAVRT